MNYFKNITKKITETRKVFTQFKSIKIFFLNKLCLRLFCGFLVRNPNCKFVVIFIKLHQLIIYNILKIFKSATCLLKLLNNQFFLFVNRSYFIQHILAMYELKYFWKLRFYHICKWMFKNVYKIVHQAQWNIIWIL